MPRNFWLNLKVLRIYRGILSEVVTCPNGSFRKIAQSGGWIGGTVSRRAEARPEPRRRVAAAGGPGYYKVTLVGLSDPWIARVRALR